MLDESAFGLLISYFNLEDDELSGEREEFVERYAGFTTLVRDRLATAPPGSSGRAIDLGHALYVELLEGEQADLITWLRQTRAALTEQGYQTGAVLTFGAAWVDDQQPPRPDVIDVGTIKLLQASLPSEPLRRALLAEAATRRNDEAGPDGWGPGLYLDVDAVEALGRKPKNAPTILRCGDAEFFRAGS